jgi:hypothetical protein
MSCAFVLGSRRRVVARRWDHHAHLALLVWNCIAEKGDGAVMLCQERAEPVVVAVWRRPEGALAPLSTTLSGASLAVALTSVLADVYHLFGQRRALGGSASHTVPSPAPGAQHARQQAGVLSAADIETQASLCDLATGLVVRVLCFLHRFKAHLDVDWLPVWAGFFHVIRVAVKEQLFALPSVQRLVAQIVRAFDASLFCASAAFKSDVDYDRLCLAIAREQDLLEHLYLAGTCARRSACWCVC